MVAARLKNTPPKKFVIPAQAGIQLRAAARAFHRSWAPAFAGATD